MDATQQPTPLPDPKPTDVYVLHCSYIVSDATAQRFKELWNSLWEEGTAPKLLVLSEGMTLQRLGVETVDYEALQQRVAVLERVVGTPHTVTAPPPCTLDPSAPAVAADPPAIDDTRKASAPTWPPGAEYR